MSTEELLIRRIKLKADWPGCQWPVGTIFPDNFADFKKWPHLFEELPWWAERYESDMPQYVKLHYDNKIHYVHKVEKWSGDNYVGYPLYEYMNKVNYQLTACVIDLEPATESEYNEYLKQSKKIL